LFRGVIVRGQLSLVNQGPAAAQIAFHAATTRMFAR
jgi:hypothetical protein